MGLAYPTKKFKKDYPNSSTSKIYTINLTCEPDPEIDIDELECIIQQLEAIACGWGHDFGQPFIKDEIEVTEWRWNYGNPVNDKRRE